MFQVRTKITRNNFRSLSRQGRQAAARRNKELADETVEIAKGLVHVISGKTRDSIHSEVNERTGSASAVASEGAIFEELGTVYRPPHPFLRPAAEMAAKRTRNRKFQIFRG